MTLEDKNKYFEKDYYAILGVSSAADDGEIKKAYRKLAFQFHPDMNRDSQEATFKMAQLNEAYAILSDPEKRTAIGLSSVTVPLESKFKKGDKVKINYHSTSPYRDRVGVVNKEPVKDTFRFWYSVTFESKGFSTISRFAEEELSEAD